MMKKSSNPFYLIVDGAYYSDDNAEEAKEKSIALVPTDIVGKKQEDGILGYDKFVIDEKNHTVKSCPAGRTPVQESGYIYNYGEDGAAISSRKHRKKPREQND